MDVRLTRNGEQLLLKNYGGVVWLCNIPPELDSYHGMDPGDPSIKTNSATLLLGIGEKIALRAQHLFNKQAKPALYQHETLVAADRRYVHLQSKMLMRVVNFHLVIEKYLLWLLQLDAMQNQVALEAGCRTG